MEQFPFIFTVFFMLLGPIKIIPAFAGLTRGADSQFKRDVAIRAIVIASVLCAFVALAGDTMLGKFHISIPGLRISGGLVLLIAALELIFKKSTPSSPNSGKPTAMQLAVSPVAAPIIVPPAGVAAILITVMLAPLIPGAFYALVICLAIMMVLDFLVMYFIDWVMKPSLMLVLAVFGAVLIFVQVCLAIETILNGLRDLGIVKA
jgi:multiple antibiotic resistance protein